MQHGRVPEGKGRENEELIVKIEESRSSYLMTDLLLSTKRAEAGRLLIMVLTVTRLGALE